MSFEDYIQESFPQDIDFQQDLSNEVNAKISNLTMVYVDPEIEIESYDKESKEAIIKATWTADTKSGGDWEGVEPSGNLIAQVKIQSNGSQPAKFTLIRCIDVDPTA
jgi:hypothetical protein